MFAQNQLSGLTRSTRLQEETFLFVLQQRLCGINAFVFL